MKHSTDLLPATSKPLPRWTSFYWKGVAADRRLTRGGSVFNRRRKSAASSSTTRQRALIRSLELLSRLPECLLFTPFALLLVLPSLARVETKQTVVFSFAQSRSGRSCLTCCASRALRSDRQAAVVDAQRRCWRRQVASDAAASGWTKSFVARDLTRGGDHYRSFSCHDAVTAPSMRIPVIVTADSG